MLKDLKWNEIRAIVFARDNYKCRLISLLSKSELEELIHNAQYLINIVDPAHILRRSVFPQLKYESNNIILLNRYSHSQLDQFKNPITGKYMNKELTLFYWKKIIGDTQLNQLKIILKELQIKNSGLDND